MAAQLLEDHIFSFNCSYLFKKKPALKQNQTITTQELLKIVLEYSKGKKDKMFLYDFCLLFQPLQRMQVQTIPMFIKNYAYCI